MKPVVVTPAAPAEDYLPAAPALHVGRMVLTEVKAMEELIRREFEAVWCEEADDPPPVLYEDTVLLDTGLDSLGFAVIVTRLEEELGYDPFSVSDDAFYPQTFGEFVRFYEEHAPVS
jgi:acyl carrier protein